MTKRILLLPALVVVGVAACGTSHSASTSPTTPSPATTTSPAAVDLATLTEEWGCGFGFFAANPAQTTALHLMLTAPELTETEVDLPDPAWTGSLIHGTNLFANWCDDVIEPGEPTPVEHETLMIVGGHLSIVGEVPDPFSGGRLTVEAADLEVQLLDGTRVQLGSIEITNPSFGFMAG